MAETPHPRTPEPELMPAPTGPHAAKRLWFALTGGAQGCPRKRFFLTLVPLSFLLAVISQYLTPCFVVVPLWWMHHEDPCLWVEFLLALLGVLSLCLGGGVTTFLMGGFLDMGFLPRLVPPLMVPADLAGVDALNIIPYRLVLYLGAPLALLTGAVVIGLAWRRLRDAGYSPLWLLLSLWSLVPWGIARMLPPELDLSAIPCAQALAWLLYNIGNVCLLGLYCLPTRRRELPAPPTETPTP